MEPTGTCMWVRFQNDKKYRTSCGQHITYNYQTKCRCGKAIQCFRLSTPYVCKKNNVPYFGQPSKIFMELAAGNNERTMP